MISSLVDEKKRKKKDLLIAAALELFLEKGSEETSIDEIVRKAGVAKGTFYLYFHDRGEILRAIASRRSAELIQAATGRAERRRPASEAEGLLYTVEELIDEYTRQPALLGLIHKNLTWNLLGNGGHEGPSSILGLELAGGPQASSPEMIRMAFIVLELVTSVCFNSLILGEPAGIDVMKPFLLTSIGRLLSEEGGLGSQGKSR